jgi:hypothetical protein
LEALANLELVHSQFRGVLPAGGNMPITIVGADNKFDGNYVGWSKISFKSKFCPDVYDANGQLLEPMIYGPALFNGQMVDVLTSCYEYNNKQKGIGAGLDALEPIVAANAVRTNYSTGGGNTAAAFGGGGGAPPYQAPAQQQAYQAPAQQQAAAPPYQAPAQQQAAAPPYQAPAQQQAAPEPMYQAPDGQYTAAQLTAAGYPPEAIAALPVVGAQPVAQAHNFIPQ